MTQTVFFAVVTLALFYSNKWLYGRFPRFWTQPLLLTPFVLLLLLAFAGIPFEAYQAHTHWLLWFLGPATIAFALPIYQHRALIRDQWLALSAGTLAGVTMAVGSSWLLARAFGLPPALSNDLLVRSVSTPFAMELAQRLGGDPDLTAMLVVATGVAGVVAGEFVLAWLPRHSQVARGASYGATAHAVGTAKAREFGEQLGLMASLLMIFSGLLMVLLVPLLSHLLA
jgi:putative effector of murein hydrolase